MPYMNHMAHPKHFIWRLISNKKPHVDVVQKIIIYSDTVPLSTTRKANGLKQNIYECHTERKFWQIFLDTHIRSRREM